MIDALRNDDRLIDLAFTFEQRLCGPQRKEKSVTAELCSRGEDANDLDALVIQGKRTADPQTIALGEIIAEHGNVGTGLIFIECPSSDEFRVCYAGGG